MKSLFTNYYFLRIFTFFIKTLRNNNELIPFEYSDKLYNINYLEHKNNYLLSNNYRHRINYKLLNLRKLCKIINFSKNYYNKILFEKLRRIHILYYQNIINDNKIFKFLCLEKIYNSIKNSNNLVKCKVFYYLKYY